MNRELRRNPVDYIEHLQQQNRLKRQREHSEIQKRQETIQRETGFQVYLRGANENRVKDHRIREQSERSKSPVIRQRWVTNLRPKWAKPKTPLSLKETLTTPSEVEAQINSVVKDSPEAAYGVTTLATAGSFVLATRSISCDLSSVAERISKLSDDKRSFMLKMLTELEGEEEVPVPTHNI